MVISSLPPRTRIALASPHTALPRIALAPPRTVVSRLACGSGLPGALVPIPSSCAAGGPTSTSDVFAPFHRSYFDLLPWFGGGVFVRGGASAR